MYTTVSRYQSMIDFLRDEWIYNLPKMASYGRKYKQYLTNDYSSVIIRQVRNQLLSVINSNILDIIELLCEVDVHNQIGSNHSNFSKRVNHLYKERYSFISSFKSRSNFSAFIYWLSELIKSHEVNKPELRASRSLGFRLALDVYSEYFLPKHLMS